MGGVVPQEPELGGHNSQQRRETHLEPGIADKEEGDPDHDEGRRGPDHA